MFKRVKNYILKNYLLNVVTELEAFGTERKLWRTNADICLVLTQLLLANESLIENIRVNEFATQTVISPYINLSELETYVNDFLTQSQPFINGESSNRPKIVTSVGESNREIEFINFGFGYFFENATSDSNKSRCLGMENLIFSQSEQLY